ncbi:MAG: DUF748 domain-containing protein [Candidatus Omnitrophota bacterium]|nr:DUF748 domain-containing protein [Candidatus Omnitrophota bacterium]
MRRKIFIVIISAVIVFIALRAGAHFLKPILEEHFLKAVKDSFGGDIELSEFDISLPRGIVKLGGFKAVNSKLIKYQNRLSADEIILDISLFGVIAQKKLNFEKIYLRNPVFSLKNRGKHVLPRAVIPSGRKTAGLKKYPPILLPIPKRRFDVFRIEKLIIENFKFTFMDYSVSPPAVVNVINVNGEIDDFLISLPEGDSFRGNIHMKGQFDSEKKGRFALDGIFNKAEKDVDFNLKLALRDLDLTRFSSYYSDTPFRILEEAEVDMDSAAICIENKLDASQDVCIHDIELSEITPSSEDTLFGLPSAVVVNFFKDSESGKVEFGFNIKGTLNDPEFDPGPLIKQVLSNALRKKMVSRLKKLPKQMVEMGEDAVSEYLGGETIEGIKKKLKKIIDY